MQVEHKTEKGTVRFELLPDGVTTVKLYNYSRSGVWYGDAEAKDLNAWKKPLPKGTVLIGLTSEVTEEQAKMMVDEYPIFDTAFFDYMDKSQYKIKAIDSFKSLMQHLQVYEVNPLGAYEQAHKRHLVTGNWKEIQQRTGKWLVLFRGKP